MNYFKKQINTSSVKVIKKIFNFFIDFAGLREDTRNLREFLNKCRQAEQKSENQDITQTLYFKMNEAIINFFDEKKEVELDGREQQGAIDFKLFIIERYYFLFSTKKESKEIQRKYYKLLKKYLKNETEEIGINKCFLIIPHHEKVSEHYYRVLIEILIYLNDNIKRIDDIWEININEKPEKNMIKNSFELLNFYINAIIQFHKRYTENMNDTTNITTDCLTEFKRQDTLLFENIEKVIKFVKTVEKEKIDNNHKGIIMEKFLYFLYQIFCLYLRIKALRGIKIEKEEAEIMCQSCFFMIKQGNISSLIDNSLKFFFEIISYSNYQNNEQQNFFYNELFNNWKKYFNFEIYLQNKYVSETKINVVLYYLIQKFYIYCFKDNGDNAILWKNMAKAFEEDNFSIIKKLIEKLNDYEVNLENKLNIINLICYILEYEKEKEKLSFDMLYFIGDQLTNFFKTLYYLNENGENIGIYLKEEKQIQKDNYQKDIMKSNLENDEQNNLLDEKYFLNGFFYNLTKSKYDKYIYMKDLKYLYEILKPAQPQPAPQQNFSASDVIEKLISAFKFILKNKENDIDIQARSIKIDKISNLLSKFFFYYFYIYEKLKVNHQTHEQNEQNKILELYIKELPKNENNQELYVQVFTKLMPYIFKLYKHGLKICPSKLCISAKLVHNIFKNIRDENLKEKIFEIYFEYFSLKIYETGNPVEIFKNENNNVNNSTLILSESINNITILKSIFFNLFDCINNFEYFKNSIIPLVIDIVYLSKNSEYYGNYIYILRCFFKYLKTSINTINSYPQELRQKKKLISDFFNIEMNYILYAIIKYLVNIKEKAPFFNEMISEIIMILPIKQKFLLEMPHLIFPSLVDNLDNGNDNIQLNLINLESLMNVYIKNSESVVPFIQQNLSKITDLLSNNLLSPVNINICLASLKWLSKLGGKGRNYFKERRITPKTCPIQILSMKLKEKKANRTMDFVLDFVIDVDIDNCINWSTKTMHKKTTSNADKKLIFNFVEIYKKCLAVFFHKKIDYNYILEIKKNIINGITNFNEEEFNSEFSFRQMNEKNSKIKINNFFRKKEHFIIGKIITGYFLINSSYIQMQNFHKDSCIIENDLMEFIGNYFVMILLSKEKNNKNMLLLEQDPILFLDEILQFLFSSHPTIIKNTKFQFTEYSLKIINSIIDSLNKFFDYDYNIIKNLEIVDVIYLKFLNCCYLNDSPKIDLGLILIKVLLQKFDKNINFKYLKYLFRCISSVTSNYTNIVNIQFKKGCNNLVEVIDCLIDMFLVNDPNYDLLTEQNFDNDNNNGMIIEQNEEIIQTAKNNFIMLFDFVKYCFDDIVEKIDSNNNYTRNTGIYFYEKIIGKIPRIANLIPYLMQLDLTNFSIKEFLNYFKKAKHSFDYRSILNNIDANNNIIETNIKIKKENNIKEYILPNYEKKKIFIKLEDIFNILTKKLELRESSVTYLITCSDALNNLFKVCPCLIDEFVFSSNSDNGQNKIELYLEVIKSVYFNILLCYFNYCQISIYFKNFHELFKSKLVYLFMEQLLVEKNLEFNYEIFDDSNNKIILKKEVPEKYIKYIEKYINQNSICRNEVNNKDNIVAEIFENLGLMVDMVKNLIKLLDNIFTKHTNYFTKEKRSEKELNIFNEYKKKTTQLIFLQIINLRTDTIIEECSKFMQNIIKNDKALEEEILANNIDKINNIINKITLEDIRESNCAINEDGVRGLQKEDMISLIIISKSMNLGEVMIKKLIQNLKHFETISEERLENSQIILLYGFISIFLNIDLSNNKEIVYNIFKIILNTFKENLKFPSKNLINFHQTKFGDNIIKLISKYRNYFSRYLIENTNNINNNTYAIKLIKIIISQEKNFLICESLFKEIVYEFKNEIINKLVIENYTEENLKKIAQLFKICKKISEINKIYLKSTSLLEIIYEYMKNLILYYYRNIEKLGDNTYYHRIIKNWLKLNIIYIKSFYNKKSCINSLFFYYSLPNLSKIEKNKIELFLTYGLNLSSNEKNYEKNCKTIMNSFITLDNDIKKYFDFYVDILILPLMINYYNSKNFFKCFNVSLNKEKLDINENEIIINDISETKKEKKNNYDEEYLLETLEQLTLGLYKIKFKKEKKEENKYKLLTLLIVLYKEFLSQKNINEKYNQKIKNIYYNIQALLSYSPLYENIKQVGLWRIYLFFGICLFTEQKTKEEKQNLEIIFNFDKKLIEDYSDIQNLTYELILPNSINSETLFNLYRYHTFENPNYSIYFLKIILKYPKIINRATDLLIKEFLNNTYELMARMARSKNLFSIHKKVFMQIIGLFILYLNKEREKKANAEKDKNINFIEQAVFMIWYRFYRYLIQYLYNDVEIFEVLKKVLIYFREFILKSNKINLAYEFKFQDFQKLIHAHIQLMRISFFSLNHEFLFLHKKNLEHYFIANKYMVDNNFNHRIFNDYMLIFRFLTDQETFFKLNKKEKIPEIYSIYFKISFLNQFKEIFKDRNYMKDKFTNYDIKDFFSFPNIKGTDFYESIIKRVYLYLKEKRFYPDINNNIQNQNIINNQIQNQVIFNQQQMQTLSSTDAQTVNIPRNNPPIIPIQQPIPQEKWMESFHIYEFKNFIFYRKYCEKFYSQIDSMIEIINNNSINGIQSGNYNLNLNLAELKSELQNKLTMKQDQIEFIHYCTFCFFENFYFFTLFFLQEYNNCYKKGILYNNPLIKEIKEYFNSSHNFFYNLRNSEDFNKIKEEPIELIYNEIEREHHEQNKISKKYIYYILCIYPDIILSAFLFFFHCDEIMEKYYNLILDLFLHTYRYFLDKFYEPLLEYLVKEIMNHKFLKNKPEEINKFMLKFLKSLDQLSTFKVIRTSENIINIFKNYLENYLTQPNFNKNDINIKKSLRIILYIISKFDLNIRKPIFELIKAFIGNKVTDCLKWIFTYDENEEDVYYFIYFETIPLSIDLFLSYFDEDTPLIINDNNFSKFKKLCKFNSNNNAQMEIEEIEKYDKNEFIKKMVENCNNMTTDKKVSDLLDPIRTIITFENSSYNKIFVVVFTQLWKMLSMSEREIINMYINEFLYKYASKQRDRNNNMSNMIINLLLGAFGQCSPLIYIKPVIIQSLIPFQHFWSTNILYLENLLINGVDIPSTYNSLISIFSSLKEEGFSNGLKYYFSDNSTAKEGYSELQAENYQNAEKIFYECFDKLNKNLLDSIENINIDNFNLAEDNLELFNELSAWEDGLIECYENNDNWSNIIELSEKVNNPDLRLKGLWHYGSEKWKDIEIFVKDIQQYYKADRSLERYNLKNSYIIQINEIYSLFKTLIENNNNNINDNNISNKSQTICMKCIQNIYQNFSSLHPKNLEIIDYYYFLIFQLAVESWESTNTLNDIVKKLRENTPFYFKDNLLLWRERLPHYSEGFSSLKNVLEPRNYLFKTAENVLNQRENAYRYKPNYSDKVWTDMIFMKYARKLGLFETFYQKKKIFEEENRNDMIRLYPYEMYLKEIECIKLIRNNTYNYDLGINLCNEAIDKFNIILDDTNKDFIDFAINSFKRNKAFLYYKKGKIIDAHNLFIEASVYKNKESTDYHLYMDWGEMCEEIAKVTMEGEECNEWFDNTIHNFIYMIIYKLDKAKFVIPRMIDFIKEFEKQKLKNKFNNDLDEIPVWIWLFWLPILFENFNFYQDNEEKNDFFFYILKKVAHKYKQMFYYPYKVYNKIIKEKSYISSEQNINNKYEELYNIISSENKFTHFMDKIEIIIKEFSKKEENNRENSLNSILTIGEINTFRTDNISNLKEFFKKVALFLGRFPDLKYFTNDIINLMDSPDVTRSQLREFVIKNKYYINNLILTENKYEKLSKLIDDKLFNTDFSSIEVPGYFSNKIIEPTEQNILYILKLESEYSYKFITDAKTKILIRCSNDKLMSFILENQDADKNIDKKLYIMQILFNHIFEKNYQTYKRKIKFYVPIKFFISSKLKIIEEDIYYKYNMDEIYEYCLQKRGYFPHIAYQIFEEEGKKNNLDSNYLYYSEINNEKLFKRMCKILPQDSLKNFLHKFILKSEDILLFRKQFAISYAINNLINFIILDNTILKNISFNKETGFCIFNTDLTMLPDNEYDEIKDQKIGTPLRLTKNINYFLNVTSIYGIIPGIFNFSCKALLNKPKRLKSILKICLDNGNNNLYKRVDKIANNYVNKFKYVINISDDADSSINNFDYKNTNDNNKDINKNEKNSMKNIYELIDNSMSDERLMRKSIDYEAWF